MHSAPILRRRPAAPMGLFSWAADGNPSERAHPCGEWRSSDPTHPRMRKQSQRGVVEVVLVGCRNAVEL